MMRLLVDLNLVLDVLLDREPHVEAAASLWGAVEAGEAEGLLAAHNVTTLHYLAARSGGGDFATECVEGVMSVFGVAPVDQAVLRRALAMGWTDFEDAVCTAAAEGAGCHAITTHNAGDFADASLPVLSATEALAALRA